MSLWESQESTGEVSLAELFETPDQIGAINKMDIEQLAFLTCRGGWPLAVDMENENRSITAYKSDFEAIYGIITTHRNHKYKPRQLCQSDWHNFQLFCSQRDGAIINSL